MADRTSKGIRRELAENETDEIVNSLAAKYGVDPPSFPRLVGPSEIDMKLIIAEQQLALVRFLAAILERIDNSASRPSKAKNR